MLWEAIRGVIFFGGGMVISWWLLKRPPDELHPTAEMDLLRPNELPPREFDPRNPPAGFARNVTMPYAGFKLVAFWVWLFMVNISGCTIGAENLKREYATMPTPMVVNELQQERARLRDKYGDAWMAAQMQHWQEK